MSVFNYTALHIVIDTSLNVPIMQDFCIQHASRSNHMYYMDVFDLIREQRYNSGVKGKTVMEKKNPHHKVMS